VIRACGRPSDDNPGARFGTRALVSDSSRAQLESGLRLPPPVNRHRRRSLRAALIIALFGLLAGIDSAVSATLTYEDARTTLRNVSDLRKASEAGVEKNEYEAHAADSLGLPDLSVNATQIFGVKTGSITGTPLGTIDIDQNLNGPRASINSTWAIYTGGRIRATQRALAAGVSEARAELTGTEDALDLTLAQTYFGLELATDIEHTRSSVLDLAGHQLERAVRFEQQGTIAKVERLNAQVARDEAARNLVEAQRDREIAAARLQRLLHLDAAPEASTPLFVITDPLKPLHEWLSIAERQSPVLAAFDAKKDQAREGIVIADSAWKPQVFAFGSYGLIKHYQTLVEPDWIAGVGVNFTLFSHEDRASKVSAAHETLRQVESLQDEARITIDTAVETSYRKVEQGREQFNLLDSTLALARENLRLRERGFDEGQATSIDVNDARNALARAETERALAAHNFVIALAALLEASGDMHTLPDYIRRADVQLRP
jgi:outer membrane protein TolC